MKKTITIALVALISFNLSAKGKDTPLTFNKVSINDNSTFALRPAKRGDGDGIKGKIMVTAGVGLNLFKTNLAVRYALSSVYTYAAYTPTWKQTPMINAAVDYGLGKKVSVGVAFGYQRAVGTYTDGVFSFQDTWTRIHLAARGDYYIVATDNISLYTGLKVGYNIYNVSTTVSNTFYPNYITELNVHPSPVSVQAHFGFSYYFAKIVGVNAEVGIGYGGPYLFALGVTIKI